MTDVGQRFRRMRDQYMPAVDEVMDRAMQDTELHGSPLWEMLSYQRETGGKRLRAVVPLMVAQALGDSPRRMVPFGACCELIHNATLVHDDLQDGDRTRRGRPAVWAKFGASRAINLGDALLFLAPRCLDYLEVDSSLRWKVACRVFHQVLSVIDGQEREFALRFSSACQDDYVEMVVGKTSGLFALPMVEAARICGAEQDLLEALEVSAQHLGVLFQLQDDVLDLYGEKGRDLRGGDLREGKVSALALAFRDQAPVDEVERLKAILTQGREEVGVDDVAWAAEQFQRRGALDRVLQSIDEHRRHALAVEGLKPHPELAALLDGLADLFVEPIQSVFDS